MTSKKGSPHIRWTIRLRLTVLYGVLFLVAGFSLLTVTYALVAYGPPWTAVKAPTPPTPPAEFGPGPKPPDLDLQDRLAGQRAEYLRGLLMASGVALLFMTLLSVWLGWLTAGRVLRPLRAMAVAAKAISANDLHRRLSAPGPADEIKDLADTFDELLDHLESAFEAQRRFVANASHELRTPLTFERSLLEVSLADPAADLRGVCVRILASNERQGKLIEALLTLARSQRGLDRRTHLDLAILAEEVLDLSIDADHRIEADLNPAPVLGDSSLVERLITNLLDNAARHNVSGGKIMIWTGLDDGRPSLRISNTGPVVPPDQVDMIFQPFQRLQATRLNGHEGWGVGLSIVAAITSAHDAELRAEALPDGGLTVRIYFRPTA
jgi:signal transduction histidine kinase